MRVVVCNKTDIDVEVNVRYGGCIYDINKPCSMVYREAIIQAHERPIGEFRFNMNVTDNDCHCCSRLSIAESLLEIDRTLVSQFTIGLFMSTAVSQEDKMAVLAKALSGEGLDVDYMKKCQYQPKPNKADKEESEKPVKKKKERNDRDNDVA
jgi:predicted proteasome-type protease